MPDCVGKLFYTTSFFTVRGKNAIAIVNIVATVLNVTAEKY